MTEYLWYAVTMVNTYHSSNAILQTSLKMFEPPKKTEIIDKGWRLSTITQTRQIVGIICALHHFVDKHNEKNA